MNHEASPRRMSSASLPRSPARAATALVALIALTALAPAAQQEVDAPCSPQQPMCYGERALCVLSSPSEFDVYQFVGTAGDEVRVTLAVTGGCFSPRVAVLNPDGSPNASTTCVGCVCSSVLPVHVTSSGVHTIIVSDSILSGTGSYALDLQRLAPLGPVPILEFGHTVPITLDHPSDHDWLEIQLGAGTQVNLAANVTGGCFSPKLEVFDQNGVSIASSSCVGCVCSLLIAFNPVQTSGTYFVAVSDSIHSGTGTIDVSLSCIFGTCTSPVDPRTIGTSYCSATTNSTGAPATISAVGSKFVVDNDLHLIVHDVPHAKVGIFLVGVTQANVPLANSWGPLCIQQPLSRQPIVFTCNDGDMHLQLDLASPSVAPYVAPGSASYFQAWFRDPTGAAPKTTNTSDGLRILFM